ncbi:MAG: sugar ABC transporter substrate-binding protein [Defluviitaleaceae bacterium]|nr:sugar ABC transporter substrate-binding protein [Defluviitaleaceae bacterium]
MKKYLISLAVLTFSALFVFAACATDTTPAGPTGPVTTPPPIEDLPEIVEIIDGDARLLAHGLSVVSIDGEDVFRFDNPRNISVAVWNRGDSRMPHISQSYWAEWIQAEMLRLHNVYVTFVEIPRWDEVTFMAGLLATGEAPDVSFTFEYPNVEALAGMGGILDLSPLMINYRALIPNFYTLQGTENVWWNRDPVTGELWAFATRHYASSLRIGSFVRGDWLEALDMEPPTTLQEFEDMLFAFRDNADLLLGADAGQMIPYRLTQDVGWTGDPLLTSFIPSDLTDRQWFIYGFDDRRFMYPGIKEGARVLNRWYNEGLLWPDFSLHQAGDAVGDDLIMTGFVGAFCGNWDYPFRPSPGIITNMQQAVGDHAHFVPVAPFLNDAGETRMIVPHGTCRSLFFPHTNTEPIASLLYLDFISRPEVREFIMFGYEDIHFHSVDGSFEPLSFDYVDDHMFIPSLRNFDLLPTFNGIPPLANPGLATLVHAFEGIDPQIVASAVDLGLAGAFNYPRVVTRAITAEARYGGGLQGAQGMGNGVLNRAINASVADFDSVFDSGMADYMAAGGAAIIAERNAAWVEMFGDVDMLP